MTGSATGPGTLLARRFELQDLLDETEGARFYRARDRVLNRNVAVHVVDVEDPRASAMLVAARTSATVSDPHLLRVLDAATEDGVSYVVNEWGAGTSLDELLADGPLSPRRAAWLVKEAAEAVVTAHRHGIAHGRLIPENVVVTDSGSVKLVGFVVDAVLRGRDRWRVTDGVRLDEHEADVVNLAALLYACLVARWPGTAGSRVPTAPVEHGRTLRPRQVRAGVPRPLDAICERVLNPDGHSSPLETAHEVYAALADYIGDPVAPTGLNPVRPVLTDPRPDTVLSQADEPTRAVPAPLPDAHHDPEATQAAPPPARRASGGAPERVVPRADVSRADVSRAGQPRIDEPTVRVTPAGAFPPGRTPAVGVPAPGPSGPPVPPSWAPDPAVPAPGPGATSAVGYPGPPPARRGRQLAAVLLALLVLVGAVVLAFNLGRGSTEPSLGPGDETAASPSPDRSEAPARPVAIAAVSDFDPQGDPAEEHPEEVPLSVDGDPATAWGTLTYEGSPELGNLKDGVGLLVDLGRRTDVAEVSLRFLGRPTSFEVFAGGDSPPRSVEGLTRIGGSRDAGPRASVTPPAPASTRYVVVWLTSLPPVPGGFQGRIAEITVRA